MPRAGASVGERSRAIGPGPGLPRSEFEAMPVSRDEDGDPEHGKAVRELLIGGHDPRFSPNGGG